jgi:hypothetical protein
VVGERHDVIRVGDLHGVGEHRFEHHPIRAREIERRPADPVPPRRGSGGEPGTRFADVASGDDVEQLATLDVDDLGRPQLAAIAALSTANVSSNPIAMTSPKRPGSLISSTP